MHAKGTSKFNVILLHVGHMHMHKIKINKYYTMACMTYLSSKSGRTISGRIIAKLWYVEAASALPTLLNMAIFNNGSRHCTNASISVSFSFTLSGTEGNHSFFSFLSLSEVGIISDNI